METTRNVSMRKLQFKLKLDLCTNSTSFIKVATLESAPGPSLSHGLHHVAVLYVSKYHFRELAILIGFILLYSSNDECRHIPLLYQYNMK